MENTCALLEKKIKPFTSWHQYAYSLYFSLYISWGADEENLFNNQRVSLVGDHFSYSHDLNV